MEQRDNGIERIVVHDLLAAVGTGVGRDGHAPVALARDAPVGTLLNHGADTVGGVRGIPLHVVLDLIAGSLAQAGLVHGDEPLIGGAEQHRVLAAPAMGIAVGDLLLHHQGAALAQKLDDVRVGLVGVHAGERAAGAKLLADVELAVVIDGHADLHALLDANVIVVGTVTGRVVDDTGTVVDANVISKQGHALDALEDGLFVVQVMESLGGNGILLAVNEDRGVLPAELLAACGSELLEHDLGAAVVLDGDVRLTGLERDRLVGRNRPRGRGPDDEIDRTVEAFEAVRLGGELEAHEDGGRRLVGVLDLRLGECGMAVLAPVDGLVAAIDHAAIEHGLEDLDVGGIVLVVKRQVGVVPIAQHAQTTETGLLQLDVLYGELVAQLANLCGRGLVELRGPELLLDLMLDRLTMAVPAGHIRNLAALHGPVAVDHVLGDLIHRVADVNRAVGIRGAVVQDELLMPLVLLERLLVDLVVLPVLKPYRLGLGEAGSHGESGLGQVHGLLVLVGHDIPSTQCAYACAWALKKRPSLQAGTKRRCCDAARALRLTTQLRCKSTRYSAGL